MTHIVIPYGERLSRPLGDFNISPAGVLLCDVETVEQTRRVRLGMLIQQHQGLANLCEQLGYSRKETSGLSRIFNGNLRHDRDGEPYHMGSPMARGIECKLQLPVGWMDTPPDYFEIHHDAHIANVVRAMEALPEDWQREKMASIVVTLLEAPPDRSSAPVPTAESDGERAQRLVEEMQARAHAKHLARTSPPRTGKRNAA